MIKTALVTKVSGKYAEIKVERSSMCDNCSAKGEKCACSHAALLGADKSMTAKARCRVAVCPGDTVEIETSDSKVLKYAAFVFILPLIAFAVFYAAASALSDVEAISFAAGTAGFILSFVAIGIFERCRRDSCDIDIIAVVKSCDENN